jgi:hypothetical protein
MVQRGVTGVRPAADLVPVWKEGFPHPCARTGRQWRGEWMRGWVRGYVGAWVRGRMGAQVLVG